MSDIHTKLAKIAGEIGPINKDAKNKEQNFMFRSIESITERVRPLFAEAGISIAPKVISFEYSDVTSSKGTRGFRCVAHVGYTFTAAEDGSSIELSMVGEAIDYGDKSTSKAVQMAFKYALTQALLIGSGEADPDSHTPEAMAPREVSAMTAAKLKLVEAVSGDSAKAKELWNLAATTLGYQEGQDTGKDSEAVLRAALAQVGNA